MLDTTLGRFVIGLIVAFALVALLAWARNGPGVGGREPDPPSTVVVIVPAPQPTTAVETVPPTTDEAVPPTT